MRYVNNLLDNKWNNRCVHQADIGIISPYRKQCDLITKECRAKGYYGITIGTAEVFQGQEKPIMIISTVRTKGGSLGFLTDSRVSI